MRTLVVALTLLALGAGPAWAQEDPFTVTTPDGRTYGASAEDLAHWTAVDRRSGSLRRTARARAFYLLVASAWFHGEADERGIVVTHEEVVREFRAQRDSAFPNRRAYRRFLRENGLNVDDILFRMHSDMRSARIREQLAAEAEASVTEAEVDAYLAEHGSFGRPERRDVRIVLTERRSEAEAAKRELLDGASWRSVTRRYSVDGASRPFGGRMPSVERGRVERPLQRAIFNSRPGRIVGPVRTQFGYYVVRVTRVHPAREFSDARSRALARAVLVEEAHSEVLEQFIAAFDAKWRARTSCAPEWRSRPQCGATPG